jgi:hypothetical protein
MPLKFDLNISSIFKIMERESDIDAVVDHDDEQISKKQRMATPLKFSIRQQEIQAKSSEFERT